MILCRHVMIIALCLLTGNVRARVDPTTASSRDHLVQQLSPVSTWGREFVTMPIPRNDETRGDIFHITGSVANTFITIDIKNTDGTSSSISRTINNAG